MDSRNDLRDCG